MTKSSNLLILLILSLIWSSYAVFTKIASAEVSPFFISFLRLFIGGLLLYSVCFYQKNPVFLKKNFKNYAVVGLFNSAIPFLLFSFAAKNLDSGILTILEGATLIFEVLITVFIFKKYVSGGAIFGVIIGIIGVVITSINLTSSFQLSAIYITSILAILVATLCFASSSIYIKNKCCDIEPIVIAAGSVISAAFFLSPILFFTDFAVLNNFKISTSLIFLGLFCTGVVYILYFKLIAEEGSRVAVTYSLIIPICGTALGTLFLDETLTSTKLMGCGLIMVSIKFILDLSLKTFTK